MRLATKRMLFCAVVTALAIASILIVVQRERHPLETPREADGGKGLPLTNAIVASQSTPATTSAPAAVDWRTGERVRKMNDYFNSMDGTVRFYGRVLDQNGQPVDGARITASLARHKGNFLLWIANPANNEKDYNPIEQESAVVSTDSAGDFAITDRKGFRLDIQSIAKDGSLDLVAGESMYGLKRSTYRYGKERDPDVSNIQPDNPVIFRLLKKGAIEPSISQAIKLQLLPESVTRLNVVSGHSVTTDQYDLEIRLTGKTTVVNATKRFGDWMLSLEAKSGGFLMTADDSTFEAPETGYLPALQFEAAKPEDLLWSRSGKKKRVFFRGRNGQVTALLSVQFDVHPWEGGRLRIETLVNTTGSRNLEPDPEKQITDPEEIRRLDEATRVK